MTLLLRLHVRLKPLVHQNVLTYRKAPAYYIKQLITHVMVMVMVNVNLSSAIVMKSPMR